MAKPLLPKTWNVPQRFLDRLGEQVGRQRTMVADGQLLIVLHRPPRHDEDEREGRFFWRKADETWSSSTHGAGQGALRAHIEEYAARIEALEEKEVAVTTAEHYFDLLQELAPLHRATRNMHATLQEARTACPDDRALILFRDEAYELERRAELLYTDSRNALDFAIARRAEEQTASSRRMEISAHRLNVLVAVFFPIATLTAVFGVNLRHGLEEFAWPWPFIGLVLGGLLCGALLKLFVDRPPPA